VRESGAQAFFLAGDHQDISRARKPQVQVLRSSG
jgi:hypothetical protein